MEAPYLKNVMIVLNSLILLELTLQIGELIPPTKLKL
ncbi:MAG: hypothetical protein ACJAXY_002235 [Nonlabens sp.]|jgi:hypothetical protein